MKCLGLDQEKLRTWSGIHRSRGVLGPGTLRRLRKLKGPSVLVWVHLWGKGKPQRDARDWNARMRKIVV